MRKHDEARGSLDVRKGFPFLPKKMKFAEFFSGKGKAWNKADNFCLIVRKHDEARGSLGTRQTILASLCASTMRQGEALGQGRQFLTHYA